MKETSSMNKTFLSWKLNKNKLGPVLIVQPNVKLHSTNSAKVY